VRRLVAATRRGESPTAGESAAEKAGASSRTPKLGCVRLDKLFERGWRAPWEVWGQTAFDLETRRKSLRTSPAPC